MTLPKLPSFGSSLADSFKVRWPWSNSSAGSSDTGSQSSWASESNSIQASSAGARRRKSVCPPSSSFQSRETSQSRSQDTSQPGRFPNFSRGNLQASSSHTSETESFPRTYHESTYASELTPHQRSDQSYGQSFTISSRLKRAILSPTKFQIVIGSIILVRLLCPFWWKKIHPVEIIKKPWIISEVAET